MRQQLKIKVCGLTTPENRMEVESAGADLLGFIFYPFSKRYVGTLSEKKLTSLINSKKIKVGVFVDETDDKIASIFKTYPLDFVQLHGSETPAFCLNLKKKDIRIIKVFSIEDDSDFNTTADFEGLADYFLFDTKTKKYGGSGQKFDWKRLDDYKGKTPFFLSGGINPDDAEKIRKIGHPKFYGVDLNSGFEDKPGIKNSELLKNFIRQLYELPG